MKGNLASGRGFDVGYRKQIISIDEMKCSHYSYRGDLVYEFIKCIGCSLKNLEPLHWYYLITFYIPDDNPLVDDGSFDIPVLFNGQALLP